MELEKTDQEQVEELQKWWHENRLALITGLVVGIGALVGWEQWQKSQLEASMSASSMFEEVKRAVDTGNAERADTALGRLQQEHAGSSYVVDALATRAALAASNDDWGNAVTLLKEALDSGPQPAIAGLLKIRLARAYWGAGQADEAVGVLKSDIPESFAASADELLGDIEMARGNPEAARAAWERALPKLAGSQAASIVNEKLARVGGAS